MGIHLMFRIASSSHALQLSLMYMYDVLKLQVEGIDARGDRPGSCIPLWCPWRPIATVCSHLQRRPVVVSQCCKHRHLLHYMIITTTRLQTDIPESTRVEMPESQPYGPKGRCAVRPRGGVSKDSGLSLTPKPWHLVYTAPPCLKGPNPKAK